MNACNPAKFAACIKSHTMQELSRRTILHLLVCKTGACTVFECFVRLILLVFNYEIDRYKINEYVTVISGIPRFKCQY